VIELTGVGFDLEKTNLTEIAFMEPIEDKIIYSFSQKHKIFDVIRKFWG
jgi:hypothetical protein